MKKWLLLCSVWLSVSLGAQVLRPIRVALLLPLQTEMTKRDKQMDRFLDFYTGALLAVYDMQATGQPVEVHTYDVGKSTRLLAQTLAKEAMQAVDMIIGPAYASQVPMMASWAMEHQIQTLFPFSSEVPEMDYNPYVMQFNPSVALEAETMAQQLAAEGNIHCIFVTADENSIPESVRQLQNQIRAYQLPYTYTTIRQIMADSLSGQLSDTATNVLLMNTERYANVRIVMPQLERAAQGKGLALLSRYSWQSEPIILPQLYSTVFHELEEDKMTHYDALYRRFVPKAREGGRPCYDLLGYDLMTYTLQSVRAWHQEEQTEREDILCRPFRGVQSDMRFERVGEGGYQNKNISIVQTK
ncbi:MAG: hypothetical protein MJZ65_02225 [Paludibacteraceae bacterium]|nr:hypothetical protein [Paludibacteraceae bacterium]